MRICFLAPQLQSGAYGRRGFSFLKHYAEQGHEVTLHCIRDPGPYSKAEADIRALGVDVRSVGVPRLRRWWNCLAGFPGPTPLRILHCRSHALREALLDDLRRTRYDLLHVDRFRMAPFAVEAREVYRGPVIVDFPDALSLYYERAVMYPRHWAKAWIDRHEAHRIPAAEKKLLSAGFQNVVCSEVDKARLAAVDPSATISVIPHTIDLEEFSPCARNDGRVRGAFTGTLYYLPNVDGLLWLRQSVLPLVGDDRFEIDVSGYGATSELDPVKEDPHFHFKGYVERMADHLWTDDIYLCPIRVAAGVRFKLLEAFAAGMATVSTTLGFEGIDCTPGDHLLVADSPEEFARAIRHLLDHPEERARLGRNARAFMKERYSEEAFARKVEGLLASSRPAC